MDYNDCRPCPESKDINFVQAEALRVIVRRRQSQCSTMNLVWAPWHWLKLMLHGYSSAKKDVSKNVYGFVNMRWSCQECEKNDSLMAPLPLQWLPASGHFWLALPGQGVELWQQNLSRSRYYQQDACTPHIAAGFGVFFFSSIWIAFWKFPAAQL